MAPAAIAGWLNPILLGSARNHYSALVVRNDSIYLQCGDQFRRGLNGGNIWDPPINFSDFYISWPDWLGVTNDTVVVFAYSFGNERIKMHFSTDHGITWQSLLFWNRDIIGGWYPSINNNGPCLYVCEAISFFAYTQIWLWQSLDFGLDWEEDSLMVWIYPGDYIANQMIYFFFNNPYIVLETNASENSYSSISLLYSLDVGNLWNYPDTIAPMNSNNSASLDAFPSGQMALVWQDYNHWLLRPGRIYCRTSPDSGRTWNPIVELTVDNTMVHLHPRVAVSHDTVVVVFHKYNTAILRRSFDIGFNWSVPETVAVGQSTSFRRFLPDVAYDNGKIDVSYVDDDSMLLYLRIWNPETDIEEGQAKPDKFTLHVNYPNPFNSTTMIRFDVAENSSLVLEIFDIAGRKVESLANGEFSTGSHAIVWQAGNLSSGLYFARINVEGITEALKMILLELLQSAIRLQSGLET